MDDIQALSPYYLIKFYRQKRGYYKNVIRLICVFVLPFY